MGEVLQTPLDVQTITRFGKVVELGGELPLTLDSGAELGPFHIAFQTYGELNADRSNAVLACHALTGDQHIAGAHPVTGGAGWWDYTVGPGKPLDTDRFFVICSNVLGGCMGTAGPNQIDPRTGELHSTSFPVVTIADMSGLRPCSWITSASRPCSASSAARWAACR